MHEMGVSLYRGKAKSDDGYVASCKESHSIGKIGDFSELESLELKGQLQQ